MGKSTCDASAMFGKGGVDKEIVAAVVTAAIGGDPIAHHALLAGLESVSDYPEPRDHVEALATPDAERWSAAMEREFASMKRTELLSDPVPLPANGRDIDTR